MTDQVQIKIANAFYSKTRKTFLPCTASDIAARSEMSAKGDAYTLARMNWAGLVTAKNNSNHQTYDLTPEGRKLVEGAQ